MNRLISTLLIAAICTIAQAQDSKILRAQRIASAIALEESLLEQQKQLTDVSRHQVATAMKEMEKAGVPAEVIVRITPDMESLVNRIVASWDPKEATRIFSEAYAKGLTEEDVADAEKYYSTPKGKQAHAAMKNAPALMNNYILAASNTAMQQSLSDMIQKARAAAGQTRRSN